MEHTEECKKRERKILAARKAYDKNWPKHCADCQGRGGETYQYDPSPAGVSLGAGFMTDFEPCGKCLDYGFCPRCGEQMFYTENETEYDKLLNKMPPCKNCGWSWNRNPGDSMPEGWECSCDAYDPFLSDFDERDLDVHFEMKWNERMYRQQHPEDDVPPEVLAEI